MLYHCLMNSVKKIGKAKVSMCNSKYKFNRLPSRNLVLTVIIQEIHLVNNATTISIRTQVSSLVASIGTLGYDTTKFSAHVKFLLARLTERGETSNYLLTNILRGTKMHHIQFLSSTLR